MFLRAQFLRRVMLCTIRRSASQSLDCKSVMHIYVYFFLALKTGHISCRFSQDVQAALTSVLLLSHKVARVFRLFLTLATVQISQGSLLCSEQERPSMS